MENNDPAKNIGLLVLGVIGLVLVAAFDAAVLWFVARQVDSLSLSWQECMWIGLGYVAWRIMDKTAWSNTKNSG